TDPGVTDPGTTDPGDTEPRLLPASLVVGEVGGLTFVSGVPTLLSLDMRNDGEESTGVVHAELAFGPEVSWDVEVVSEPLGGVGAARAVAVTTGWTCAAAEDPSRALCTLPDL